VCQANPCLHGGTCFGKTRGGDGFICLCPYGRRGGICEEEVEVSQPSYTSWVVGYSSFLTYQTPPGVNLGFELKFHFTTGIVNQVALLLFMGQKGTHREGSDYLAISYIKGHILLTWDLGAGPRRIFTEAPVDNRIHVHTVHAGRWGRLAWLQVDHYMNISGVAPGRLASLNVNGEFFVGGHENFNFTGLPHDLPVHTGFTGCIFDIVMTGRDSEVPTGPAVPLPLRGRNVQQCQERMCDRNPCQGGFCLDYGASYSCQCPDGTSGTSCDRQLNVCSGKRHLCQEGSVCVAHTRAGYQCVCPLGRTGQFCERNVNISDARFTGDHSYLTVQLEASVRFNTHISMEIKPEKADGLILYLAQRTNDFGDFFSLLLVNGSLVFSFSLGSAEQVTTMKAACCAPAPGNSDSEANNGANWTAVSLGRRGGEGYLTVGGQTITRSLQTEDRLPTLDVSPILYLGGLPDMSLLSEVTATGAGFSRFTGCMRHLVVNQLAYPLRKMRGRTGANIADCDGTECGGEVCGFRGTCRLNPGSGGGTRCECRAGWAGRYCEVHTLCENSPCQNGGLCEVLF
jgi:EYS protein